MFTAAEGRAIEGDAGAAREAFRRGEFPFDETWQDWRPHPALTRPVLPAGTSWQFDQLEK